MEAITARRFGERGPVVVLVHGWCCDGRFWREQIGLLSAQYRVVVVELDMRAARNSLAAAGAGVAAVAERAGGEALALVGHSMGGPLALEAALRLGARCRLVAGVDTFTDAAFYRRLTAPALAARLEPFARDFGGAVRAMVDQIVLGGDNGLRRWIGDAMASVPPPDAVASLKALFEWDIEEIWPRLRCPVAAINSGPLSRSSVLIDLPGLAERRIDGVGHFPMLEAPERFNVALAGLLAQRFGLGPVSARPAAG